MLIKRSLIVVIGLFLVGVLSLQAYSQSESASESRCHCVQPCQVQPASSSKEEFQPYFSIGAKLGTSFSKVRFDPVVQSNDVEQNFERGYVGGIAFKYFAQRIMGVQLELNFMQAGWDEVLESGSTYNRKLNFIQIPVMTHAEFGWDKTKILINFGPSFSYLISEDEEMSLSSGTDSREYYARELDRRFYFGACFGVGAVRRTNIGDFQLEGRVTFNLNNCFSGEVEDDYTSSQTYGLEVTLSYFVPFKKMFGKK